MLNMMPLSRHVLSLQTGLHRQFILGTTILPTPGHVTLDHGMEFISHFSCSLGKLLGMKLHFMSRYHLEGDGQMEQINQVLEQYLRAYTNYQQDDWAALLLAVEFTYNNAPSMTTGVSPFFANKGYHPWLAVDSSTPVTSVGAQQFTADLDSVHTKLKANIAATQECYQKSTN